jgi:tRNA A37 N6-isopentenylltransferase MiaA
MIEKLEKLVDDITSLNSKLVLLIGPPRSGKTALLAQLSERRDAPVLNVGAALGRRLLAVPSTRRHLQAADSMKDLACPHA